MSDVMFIPFKKSLYDDLVRFSDGAIDPAELAVLKVEAWIDMNFALGPDDWMDDSFPELFGDRLLDFAEIYGPHFLSAIQTKTEAHLQALLEGRTPLAWKEVTVPAGSEVRMIYGGRHYYATVKNGRIVDEDGEFSPSSWAAKVTSTARNAWRDLWFKFPGSGDWLPAELLRQRARRALQHGEESDDA